MASGRLETKTATSIETPTSPVCRMVSPSTADSGTPSSTVPSTIGRPDGPSPSLPRPIRAIAESPT